MKKLFTFRGGFIIVLLFLNLHFSISTYSQQSVARQWNEVTLNCIRKSVPRPTVHARNLFHSTVAMYDAWAAFDNQASPFFLGQQWGDFECPFDGIMIPEDVQAAQEEAISYAMYRLLWTRFTQFAPPANLSTIQGYINNQMALLGYNPFITSTDYSDGDPAKLGNYIAAKLQEFALQDGSNQQSNYANLYYAPVNGQLMPLLPGNPNVIEPNQWQPLCLDLLCAQGTGPGFEPIPCLQLECNAPALSPEWGRVEPFALTEDQHSVITRDGNDYNVYLDPGPPPLLDTTLQVGFEDSFFKWGYIVNIIWHSFHNNDDGVMVDISPASVGNLNITDASVLPSTFEEYKAFYDVMNGNTHDIGHTLNPITNLPYEEQLVARKDFTRVLSQFWADGPNSETPPGHWFTILNYVMDHPDFEKKWEGTGPILSDLEWDVRAYFTLGGGIHDAAIACWGAKGAYDYTRPIMAIRWMADKGQCTDENLPHYHPAGLPLMPGFIELVQSGDELAGENDENVNKIKVFSWRGPVAATGQDGAGWLLGENWWTYQTANFVTPPFPGYYSGHSTYSRTGAEIMTRITGNEYFPGGMAEFHAPASTYLAADSGPTTDVTLQWATYRDASDQCSLSRIYGGLHPPQDDIPGRIVGLTVGPQAFEKANALMTARAPRVTSIEFSDELINDSDAGSTLHVTITFDEEMNTTISPTLLLFADDASNTLESAGSGSWLPDAKTYTQSYTIADANVTLNNVVFQVLNAEDTDQNQNIPAESINIVIDTENPVVTTMTNDTETLEVTDAEVSSGATLDFTLTFSEVMDINTNPQIDFTLAPNTFVLNASNTMGWSEDGLSYSVSYDLFDENIQPGNIAVTSIEAKDAHGNAQISYVWPSSIFIDTKNPSIENAGISEAMLTDLNAGMQLDFTFVFDEEMNTNTLPSITFPEGDVTPSLLFESGEWSEDGKTYIASYYTVDANATFNDIDVASATATDIYGNLQNMYVAMDAFSIDTENPVVTAWSVSDELLSDVDNGFTLNINIEYNEPMSGDYPAIFFSNGDPMVNSLMVEGLGTGWNGNTFTAVYQIFDANEELWDIDVNSILASDIHGNVQEQEFMANSAFSIDTKNPELVLLTANTYNVTSAFSISDGFSLTGVYNEPMSENTSPTITFPDENPTPLSVGNSAWLSSTAYRASFDVSTVLPSIPNIDVNVMNTASDLAGNVGDIMNFTDFFSINIIISVDEIAAHEGAIAYPNPIEAGHTLFLQWDKIPNGMSIDIYNAMGSLIERKNQVTSSQNQIAIETTDLVPGVYLIHANSEEGRTVFNVIVTR